MLQVDVSCKVIATERREGGERKGRGTEERDGREWGDGDRVKESDGGNMGVANTQICATYEDV